MANRTLNTRLRLKYDTAENWAAKNPVLLEGEIGIESNTLLGKVGDGTRAWQQLEYLKTDKVNAALTFNSGGNGAASGTTFDGSTARTISYNTIGAAASSHNQASNTINAMTGYSKPTSTSAIVVSDTLNTAIGKLEKAFDGKVDKVSGKGLSTNDFTTPEKEKLDGIETGANAYTLPAAGEDLGGVKSGGDVTITDGVITVSDDSHNHTFTTVTGLQAALDGKQAKGSYAEYEPLVTLTTAHAVNSIYRIANVTNSNFLSTLFWPFKVNLKINEQVCEGWAQNLDDSVSIITSRNPMGSYDVSGLGGFFDGTAGYFGYPLPSAIAGGTNFSDFVMVSVRLNAEVSCDSGSEPVWTPKTGSIAIVSMFPNNAADSDPIQLKISVSRLSVLAAPMTFDGQVFIFNYNDDADISMVVPENTSLVNFGDGVAHYPSENTTLTHSYTPSNLGAKPNALYIYGDIKHLPDNFLKGAVCLTSFELTKARTFGESAFENCVNLVCAVMHPETTTISRNAFKGCTSLKDIDLKGVTTIAESAFENCSALTSITLPDSLRQIDANAFKGTGLTTVIIPAGVTTIADTAFDSTTKLITASELSYLDGVISNIQAQLNAKGTSNFTGYTSSNKLAVSNISGLATVATSGSYNDLSNKPTIPTKSSWNYDDAYVKYSAAQSLTDAQKSQARSNIGAGTSNLTLAGSGSATTAAKSDHTHSYLPLAGGTITDGGSITLSTYGTRKVILTGNSISADMSKETGGWAGNFASVKDPAGDTTAMLGWYGGTTLTHIYMGGTYSDPYMKMTKAGQFTFKYTPKVGSVDVALTSDLPTFTYNSTTKTLTIS